MAFTPQQLPSGRWRGGFYHPITKQRIQRTFDTVEEANDWAIERETNLRAIKTNADRSVDQLRDAANATAMRIAHILNDDGPIETARVLANEAVALESEINARLLAGIKSGVED